jgi:translation initiation factor 1
MSLTDNILFGNNEDLLNDTQITGTVHLRVFQRKKDKYLTVIQGLESIVDFDKKELLKYIKQKLCCNGNITEHNEYGNILQFQGDKRHDIKDLLIQLYDINEDNIEIHG